MRASELKKLKVQALEEKLLELRKEQFGLRMKRATGVLEKFHRFGQIRKMIARVKTIMTEKQSEVASGKS